MKKILAIATAIILGTSAMHAVDIELDVMHFLWNYNKVTHLTLNGNKLPKEAKVSTRYNSPFLSFGLNANFYFMESGMAKLGMNVAGGFDFGTLLTLSSSSSIGSDATWGGGGFLKVGFAASINFNDVHSLYVSPGFILTGASGTLKTFGIDNRISTFLVGLDIDVGYRAFFLQKSNFDFGINAGINIDFPLGGVVGSKYTYTPIYGATTTTNNKSGAFGGGFKLYVGPAFRLK
ncbi:MAG: hypothetical protein IJR50_04085 [Treponema sp.]|nr:hypothetical protein [Treponema sp.]